MFILTSLKCFKKCHNIALPLVGTMVRLLLFDLEVIGSNNWQSVCLEGVKQHTSTLPRLH